MEDANSDGLVEVVVDLCQTCNLEPSKYKCPGCLFKNCSMECIEKHKLSNGCTGKRNMAKFIKYKEYTITDYNQDSSFLDQTRREVNSISRMNLKIRKNKK